MNNLVLKYLLLALLFLVSVAFCFGQKQDDNPLRIVKVEEKDGILMAKINKGLDDNISLKKNYIVYTPLLNSTKTEKEIIGKLSLFIYSTNESSGELTVREEFKEKINTVSDKLYLQILKPIELDISIEYANILNDNNSFGLLFPNLGINWYINKTNINKIKKLNTLWYIGSSLLLPPFKFINQTNNKDMSVDFRFGCSPFKKNYPLSSSKGLYFGGFYRIFNLHTETLDINGTAIPYQSYPGVFIGYQKSIFHANLKVGMVTKKANGSNEMLPIMGLSGGLNF